MLYEGVELFLAPRSEALPGCRYREKKGWMTFEKVTCASSMLGDL